MIYSHLFINSELEKITDNLETEFGLIMKDKKDNKNENNDSSHPEMNEEPIEVSKQVPNTVEELLERQNKFNIEFIEINELDENGAIEEIISRKQEKVDETIKEILKILHKNNSGLNEDIAFQ